MQPNIILINCDDLGYGDLSCYGSGKHSTPCMDQLAEEGIKFTDFYAAQASCSPSRAALMTGCYPPRVGFHRVLFPGEGIGLDPNEKTIASLLKEVGYSTMIVGKWHCGDQREFLPTNHGFDHYFGLPYSNDMGRQVVMMDRYDLPPLPLLEDDKVIQEQPDQTALTERYMEKSLKFIRDNQSRPFFLYLAHMYVHLPIYVADYFLNNSNNGSYGAGVSYIDFVTKVIVHELDKLGIRENTIILFTSDNGSRNDNGESNGPLRGQKGCTYEGGQRVPLIVNWKGHIEGGKVSNGMISNIDLLPSLCAIAGAKIPDDRIIDGIDLSDLLLGKTDISIRNTFMYHFGGNVEAMRVNDYKLHVRKWDKETQELYNLKEDIGETNNLYNTHPEIVATIMDEIKKARIEFGDENLGIKGKNVRQIGQVEHPDTLTHYDENNPYLISIYDLDENG